MAARSSLVTVMFELVIILVCTSYSKASVEGSNIAGNTEDYLVISNNIQIINSDQLKTRISNTLNIAEGKTIRNVLLSDGTSGLVLSLDKDELAKVRSTSGVQWVGKRDEQFEERTSSGRLKKVKVSNQFIVTVKPSTDEGVERARASFIDAGFEIIRNFHIGDFRSIVVKGDSEMAYRIQNSIHSDSAAVPATISNIRASISGLEADISVYATACDRAQASGDQLWGLSRVNVKPRPSSYSGQNYRYSSASDGTGVEVHVFDTGVNIEHVDFQGRASRGFTARDLELNEGDNDLHGHGTHVAGTVGGDTYGVAKGAQIVAIKVRDQQGSGSLAYMLEGMEWSYTRKQNHSKRTIVWNMSLVFQGVSHTMGDAMKEANKIGIVIVVASGNENMDSCMTSPGFSSDVITVAASGKSDGFSSFANYGKCVDIVAPGESILSAGITGRTSRAFMSGTSTACPHVAGAVARFLSSCPSNPPLNAAKNWIINFATEGVLRSVRSDTVNRLLFAPCDLHLGTYCEDNGDSEDSEDNGDPMSEVYGGVGGGVVSFVILGLICWCINANSNNKNIVIVVPA